MDLKTAVTLIGAGIGLYFAWPSLSGLTYPRSARWLLGLAGVVALVALAAALQIDRSNAGIHPEWITDARGLLGITLLLGTGLSGVGFALALRETRRQEVEATRLESILSDAAGSTRLPDPDWARHALPPKEPGAR